MVSNEMVQGEVGKVFRVADELYQTEMLLLAESVNYNMNSIMLLPSSEASHEICSIVIRESLRDLERFQDSKCGLCE